jgi:hypothetical protein
VTRIATLAGLSVRVLAAAGTAGNSGRGSLIQAAPRAAAAVFGPCSDGFFSRALKDSLSPNPQWGRDCEAQSRAYKKSVSGRFEFRYPWIEGTCESVAVRSMVIVLASRTVSSGFIGSRPEGRTLDGYVSNSRAGRSARAPCGQPKS